MGSLIRRLQIRTMKRSGYTRERWIIGQDASGKPRPVKAGDKAREILASLMEPQFPVEAEMARKGLHFMLPASWAVEAIQKALEQ